MVHLARVVLVGVRGPVLLGGLLIRRVLLVRLVLGVRVGVLLLRRPRVRRVLLVLGVLLRGLGVRGVLRRVVTLGPGVLPVRRVAVGGIGVVGLLGRERAAV
ncbi:hypothetical protein [Streptomyces sp. NPDC049906]|uniref:hypothetical protein n=1 Tax=Streptomyces sp. NPDC049906 TaxID=3155656 RepID=UPI003413BCCB